MSDEMLERNRLTMFQTFRKRIGTGIEIVGKSSYMSAILQALFACEEFRIAIILIGHYYTDLQVYSRICRLYKHMVIGKEMFVIPEEIFQFLKEQYSEENPILAVEKLLVKICNDYKNYENTTEIRYRCASEVFFGDIYIKCDNKKCVNSTQSEYSYQIGNTYIIRLEYKENESVNVQRDIDRYVQSFYQNEPKGCNDCNEGVIELSFKQPKVLIISVIEEIEDNDNDVNAVEMSTISTITVKNDQYSLFACICRDRLEKIYYCYAKHNNIWYRYKGKYVRLMQSFTHLRNVQLLFYKKDYSIDRSLVEEVNSPKVIQTLLFPKAFDSLDLYELHPHFQSVMYNETDLIAKDTLEMEKQGLVNYFNKICSLNAALQALYHCRLFRKYILNCFEGLGVYHMHLKNLFTAMNSSNKLLVTNWHKSFYNHLIKEKDPLNVILKSATNFFERTIFQLQSEVQKWMIDNGIQVYANSEQFSEPINGRNYSNVLIGREDMSSNDAWMRYLAANDNFYVTNLVSVQQMYCIRCSIGHKVFLNFYHGFWKEISIKVLEELKQKNCDSLQKILDYLKTNENSGYECDNCKDVRKDLYQYKHSISHASDVLVFFFQTEEENTAGELVLNNLDLTIDEYLVVCGHQYRCTAIIAGLDFSRHGTSIGHTWTYARADDDKWWNFNDAVVTEVGDHMPPNKRIQDIESSCLVFYEKVREITAIRKNINDDIIIHASKVGLNNSSINTSYMNAVFQCLYHCIEFRTYIIYDQNIIRQTHNILKELFINISFANLSQIDTTELWIIFAEKHTQLENNFGEYDPNFFLSLIVSDLMDESNEVIGNKKSIENMFSVIYEEREYCKTGSHNSVENVSQNFLTLHIENPNIEQTIQSLIDANLIRNIEKRETTIECKKCPINSKSEAVFQRTISHLPNILILLLNIFVSDDNGIIKLEPKLVFNETIIIYDKQFSFRACVCCDKLRLNLKEFQYHLKAFAKCMDGLFCFDGISVRRDQTWPQIKNAYLLFYEKF